MDFEPKIIRVLADFFGRALRYAIHDEPSEDETSVQKKPNFIKIFFWHQTCNRRIPKLINVKLFSEFERENFNFCEQFFGRPVKNCNICSEKKFLKEDKHLEEDSWFRICFWTFSRKHPAFCKNCIPCVHRNS